MCVRVIDSQHNYYTWVCEIRLQFKDFHELKMVNFVATYCIMKILFYLTNYTCI